MALRLKTPEEKQFPLEIADPTGSTHVIVRQATQREQELRADLWSTTSRILRDQNGPEVELRQRISMPEIMRKEIFLTLVGCNIEDDNGQPLFKFSLDTSTGRTRPTSEAEFAVAFGKLPLAVAYEIHNKVLQLNPSWGGQGE